MTDAAPLSQAPSGSAARTVLRRAAALTIEWLTRRRALVLAKQDEETSRARVPFLRRAREAIRAADAFLDPPDGTTSSPPLAMILFADSAHWLLRSVEPTGRESRASLFAKAAQQAPLVGKTTLASPLPSSLAEHDPDAFVAQPLESQRAAARSAQRWLHAAIAIAENDCFVLVRLRWQRTVRLGFAVAVVVGFVIGAGSWISSQKNPDLARGKPWRASSSYDTCDPERRRCAGHVTDIFFHTKDDDSPWLEVDLLRVQRFSRVEVRNRRDYGPERAVPLIVELSEDGKNYWEVARRVATFDVWKAKFPAQRARYVRLRVARKTFLHLEGVAVRP